MSACRPVRQSGSNWNITTNIRLFWLIWSYVCGLRRSESTIASCLTFTVNTKQKKHHFVKVLVIIVNNPLCQKSSLRNVCGQQNMLHTAVIASCISGERDFEERKVPRGGCGSEVNTKNKAGCTLARDQALPRERQLIRFLWNTQQRSAAGQWPIGSFVLTTLSTRGSYLCALALLHVNELFFCIVNSKVSPYLLL